MLYVFGKYILVGPLLWLIYRPRILGRERMKIKGRAIVISNHFALTDPILIAAVFPRWIHFMAKKELFEKKIWDFFLRKLLFTFPVDRDIADVTSIRRALNVLKGDHVFGIFPEGRRSATGVLDEFEKGAAFLALKSGAPIIPIYSDPQVFRRGRITMAVGEPIIPKEAVAGRKGKPVDILTEHMHNVMLTLKQEVEAVR